MTMGMQQAHFPQTKCVITGIEFINNGRTSAFPTRLHIGFAVTRWRWLKEGPTYVKVGGRVLYRLEDIENFEKQCIHRMRSNETADGSRRSTGFSRP
jgi:hypothetical protein